MSKIDNSIHIITTDLKHKPVSSYYYKSIDIINNTQINTVSSVNSSHHNWLNKKLNNFFVKPIYSFNKTALKSIPNNMIRLYRTIIYKQKFENSHVEASLALNVLKTHKECKNQIHHIEFNDLGEKRDKTNSTMKKELGDCTSRLSLCFLFSSSAGGLSRSMSFWRT